MPDTVESRHDAGNGESPPSIDNLDRAKSYGQVPSAKNAQGGNRERYNVTFKNSKCLSTLCASILRPRSTLLVKLRMLSGRELLTRVVTLAIIASAPCCTLSLLGLIILTTMIATTPSTTRSSRNAMHLHEGEAGMAYAISFRFTAGPVLEKSGKTQLSQPCTRCRQRP